MNLFSKKRSNIPRRRLTGDDVPVSTSSTIFQRNRTLTGVAHNKESPRIHVHHLSIKRRKLFSILLVTITTIVLLVVLISNFTATVHVSVSDTSISKTIDQSKYQKVVQDYLVMNPLGRFRFFLDRAGLSSYVSSKLTEIETVTQKGMVGIGVTNFNFKLRVPVASWKINDKQYYVDANGVPFEQNYFTSVPVVQIVDNSGASLQTGEASVSKRFLGFVGLVVSLAKSSGYNVIQAVLPLNTTRQLDISLEGISYFIKMSIDRSVGEQVEDISRAVQYFTSSGQMPTYIDVRVSGKAFYK